MLDIHGEHLLLVRQKGISVEQDANHWLIKLIVFKGAVYACRSSGAIPVNEAFILSNVDQTIE